MNRGAFHRILLLTMAMVVTIFANSQSIFRFTDPDHHEPIGKYTEIFFDSTSSADAQNITEMPFRPAQYSILNFPPSEDRTLWVRFTAQNELNEQPLFLYIPYSNITSISMYAAGPSGMKHLNDAGNSLPISINNYIESPAYVFPLELNKNEPKTFYVSFKSVHPLQLPLIITDSHYVNKSLSIQSLIATCYAGLILAIFLYNLFIFISIRDSSYLIYILYMSLLLLAQITNSGYGFYFLWSSDPDFNNYAVPLTTNLAGIAAISFAISFLRTGLNSKIGHWMFLSVIVIYFASAIFTLTGNNLIAYGLINFGSLTGAILAIVFSLYIAKKGYRPAYFFFISWIAFSSSIVVSILRNLNFIPHTIFTSYILYVGSAIEAVLLSFALADRINVLQKEKEESQNFALKISRESERLILEQNQILEQKVAERTTELQNTNDQLIDTLETLKSAQLQLVEAEKMASLGQLTAGIAHEINNPINFVKSNIRPLKLDIEDLFQVIKEYENADMQSNRTDGHHQHRNSIISQIDLPYIQTEIKSLIDGIEDGAQRTAEIVRGLRIFSRLDEGELKVANVHEGIDSTLIILRNGLPDYIKVEKHFEANGNIECQPGKLNQVFLNILTNSIQAILSKPEHQQEKIIIKTKDDEQKNIVITIKDSGIGMTEEVKHKIFEPFFTTKEVGTGTGLGMAIVFKIIHEHNGKIEVISEPGNGAEFMITLPYQHPAS